MWWRLPIVLLVFPSATWLVQGDSKPSASLKILKSIGNYEVPIETNTIEERAGANFSLLCDLVSVLNNTYYDWQVSWVKQSQNNDLRFWREQDVNGKSKMYSVLQPSEINKAVKHFQPLRFEDQGNYFCVSLKYNLYEPVEVIVRAPHNHNNAAVSSGDGGGSIKVGATQGRGNGSADGYIFGSAEKEPATFFCSEQMFQCVTTSVCIIHHYICDGKSDCKDDSDESWQLCNGEPCKGKLRCDDGRCIPKAWCCDRTRDRTCNVTNRPTCCDILDNNYESILYSDSPEYFPVLPTVHHNSPYIFISMCVLSVPFFIVLLFLILSKVMTYSSKMCPSSGMHHHHHQQQHEAIVGGASSLGSSLHMLDHHPPLAGDNSGGRYHYSYLGGGCHQPWLLLPSSTVTEPVINLRNVSINVASSGPLDDAVEDESAYRSGTVEIRLLNDDEADAGDPLLFRQHPRVLTLVTSGGVRREISEEQPPPSYMDATRISAPTNRRTDETEPPPPYSSIDNLNSFMPTTDH